nr:hypothetical protein [Tanacetum cinerariifolium]
MMVVKLGHTGESEPMFYNYLRPLTSLDEWLYALACEEDVRCLATLVRSFKLVEVYIEHGVTVLDSYLRTPWFRATLEDITDELAERDGEVGFADVARSGVDYSGLSHDESFKVDDEPILAEVSIQKPIMTEVSTQETIMAEVSTEAPIVEDVRTQEFGVEDVVIEDYVSFREDGEDDEQGNGQEDESALTDGQFFYDDEGIDTAYETEYDVQSSEDAGIDDADDVDEDFLIDEENEIVELDDDVHLFGISMDLPFDNISITNQVSDDVLKGEDVDVINADGFNSDPGNDKERNYKKRRLAKLRTEMEGVINASVERNTDPSLPTRVFQRIYACLGAIKLGFRACRRDLLGLDGAFMKGPFLGQVLVAVGLDSNNGIYLLAYALVEAKTKSSWCWDFEKCMLELKTMNPKAHKWLNKIPAEHWARSYFLGRAQSDLLLNNICEVFNGKIVRGRDKPVIILLEYIRKYCIKIIVNVQGVIDKCIGSLTLTITIIMESIKKEAHLIKVQWNGENKYQVSGSLGDQCIVDVVSMTCSCRKWKLTGIPCGKNAEGGSSESRQAQQTEPTVGQDGLGGSGVGTVIGLSAAAGEGGAGDPGGAGVASQGSSHNRWTRRRVQTKRISLQKRTPTQTTSQPSTSFKVPVSQTKNADGREMGDGVPTQSSAACGVSE